jgi:Fe-S-cluster containining protein
MTATHDTPPVWEAQLTSLRERVASFFAQAQASQGIACEQGCTSCCHVDLGVSAVEAVRVQEALAKLPDLIREELTDRAEALASRAPSEEALPCVMLDSTGTCVVYEERPMICRTQGLALRYPPDFIPEEALSARASDGSALSWCPLCYTESIPDRQNILDAVKIDELLGLIDLLYRSESPTESPERTLLRHLVVSSG